MQSWRAHGFGRSLPCLVGAGLLAGGALAPAQVPEVQAHESEPFQIRVETNVVTLRVVVRDSKGRPVGNLRREDFRLSDNGKPQEISGFSVEHAVGPAAGSAAGVAKAEEAPAKAAAAKAPQRFVALYFDDLHMDAGDVVPVRDAAWRYISNSLLPEDRVGIFTSSNQVAADFTADRTSLHDKLFRLVPHQQTNPLAFECPSISPYQAFLIDQRQDKGALGIAVAEAFLCICQGSQHCPDQTPTVRMMASQIWARADTETRQALDVADAAVRSLAALPGQRVLVLVSAGFLGATREQQVDALIDRALRQNVVVNAIDAAGLYTTTYPGGRLDRFPDAAAAKFDMESSGLSQQRDTLAALSAGTGGTFFRNSNDFNEGFRRAAQAPDVWYTLSYSPREVKFDGKFHTLKVTLDGNNEWHVEARRGYFAEPPPEKSAAEVALESLVYSQTEVRDLPASVTAKAEERTSQLAAVTVRVHLDMAALPFRKEGDRNVNTLTFVTALFDSNGRYVTGKESVLDFHLPDDKLAALRRSGADARIDLLAAPGEYRVREIVRDAESQKMAALNCGVVKTAAASAAVTEPEHPKKRGKDKKTRSMADWSIAEFVKAMPELKGLQPAQDQQRLAMVLNEVGKNVSRFFESLPDITAQEQIDMEDSYERRKEEFNYLAMTRPGGQSVEVEEFRTDANGKRVEPQPLQRGLVTKGVVSLFLHFHPLYLSDSVFRYLGTQNIDGKAADVVCFTQIPQKANVTQTFRAGARTLDITVQGVAWIDAEQHHILRMRTELLEPHADLDLKRETTESRFSEVSFKGVAQAFWLPTDVKVTLEWQDMVFRNRHRYSQFQLFRVDTKVTPG